MYGSCTLKINMNELTVGYLYPYHIQKDFFFLLCRSCLTCNLLEFGEPMVWLLAEEHD